MIPLMIMLTDGRKLGHKKTLPVTHCVRLSVSNENSDHLTTAR